MATPLTAPLRMKLLIDTKSQRVLFAEASKEVVDCLFSLLALPVATAVTLFKPEFARHTHMAGSVGNLCASDEKLGFAYGPPAGAAMDEDDDELHRRSPSSSSVLLMPASSFQPSRVFFRCHHNCGSYMTDVRGTRCPNCGNEMTSTLHYVSPAWSGRAHPSSQIIPAQSTSGEGSTAQAAAAAATYMVTDDLTVTPHSPMSTISAITLLGTLGVTELAAVEERTVRLRYTEGLGILKASLHSKTVLTDVFLGEVRA
ncbi:unnamed protein product [Urochloa decumbens]|uniref:Uncharacterized protein n=1 Tax=Urochloa decumbens TaxID=240449 RepID=A0ABC8ZA97_9POAL